MTLNLAGSYNMYAIKANEDINHISGKKLHQTDVGHSYPVISSANTVRAKSYTHASGFYKLR